MISKNDLEQQILLECNICKHIFSKMPPESYDYRPTPAQRSTTELLRYLAIVNVASLKSMLANDWAPWREYKPKVENMTAEEFPAFMDMQIEEVKEIFAGLTQEDMETRHARLPWGAEPTLDVAIMQSAVKWMAGYKMQLFLYAKANGVTDISTSNCWMGVDPKPREEKVEEVKNESVEEVA